ncbi:hypothetical protein [Daejeonella sp.]|uniref:hypothetical protein n=1 Tax=Daejeonella sp. TaxID=2805397 RepID=UPI0025C530FF|nr:hypothetical protein [Daejeonella sp.]
MRNIFTFLLLCVMVSCEQEPLKFEKLVQFSRVDTISDNGRPYYFKTDVFIVKKYSDNYQNERSVDSFAYKNRAKDLAKYASYQVEIYKYSDKTNIPNLKKNPKDFDNYTFINDMIYIYRWSEGTWTSKMKFKGRETVEAEQMIKED